MDFSNNFGNRTITALSQPLLQSRGLKGKFTFITNSTIIKTLNDIFTPSGWSSTVKESKILSETVNNGQISITAMAVVRLTVHGYTYHEDVAVLTSQMGVNHAGQAYATAVKGAVSLGLTRASRKLGSAFGLDLYKGDYEGVHDDFVNSLEKEKLDEESSSEVQTVNLVEYPTKSEMKGIIMRGQNLTPAQYNTKVALLVKHFNLDNKIDLLKVEKSELVKASSVY